MILQHYFPDMPAVPDTIPPSFEHAKEQFVSGTELITHKLINWLNMFIYMLPNMLLSLFVLIVFIWLSKTAIRNLFRLINRFSSNVAVNKVAANFFGSIVFLIGLSISLNVMSLDKAVASMLAGAGLVGLAIGFAFQDLIINFISGVIIAFKQPFNQGDLISTKGYVGMIKKMNFRAIMMETSDGKWVILPNRVVLEDAIVNYTYTGRRRVDLRVGVSYDEDLEFVERLTLKTIKKLKWVNSKRPVECYYEAFGDSSINFVVRFWIDFGYSESAFLKARSDAIVLIYKAFKKHNINIPFPIRTLDFGECTDISIKQ
ncbi:MAG: mechanosensitive ion channel family protein [Chitinophagales bacterium]